jgi:hypothetical protein
MSGHQKCRRMIVMVGSRPGCPLISRSWNRWRISFFRVSSGGTAILPCTHQCFRLSSLCEWVMVALWRLIHPAISAGYFRCIVPIRRSSSHHSSLGSSVVDSLMKASGWRRVRSWLSASPLSTPGGRERRSAEVWSFPGTCWIFRWYSWSSANHRATRRFTLRGDFQKVRFAWSVRTVTGIVDPARWGRQWARAFISARSSLS